MMHRFFHSGFMGFREAHRHIDINTEIIHAGRIFQFVGVNAHYRALGCELMFPQIHGGVIART